MQSKEPYMHSKEPYMHSKEPCIHSTHFVEEDAARFYPHLLPFIRIKVYTR